jgi:hypothetical protein
LTGTSPYSGRVAEAIGDIRVSLPFPLTGGHHDNGVKFINKSLLEWCLARHIRAGRSWPYYRNDNCFAEQKNYDVVRKTAGYFRFYTKVEREALAGGYKYLCPLYNYRYPSFRLTDKKKQEDRRYKKIYEKSPKTPFQRLIESSEVSGGKARRN